MSKKKESPKKSLTDLVGILDDEAVDKLEGILKELRRNWNLDFNKRIAEIMDMFNEGTV